MEQRRLRELRRAEATAQGAARGAGTADERRVDLGDGGAYTREEFVQNYGGLEEWYAALPVASTGGASEA